MLILINLHKKMRKLILFALYLKQIIKIKLDLTLIIRCKFGAICSIQNTQVFLMNICYLNIKSSGVIKEHFIL